MTASRRELILQALTTAITPATLAGGNVFRSRQAAISSDECPSLIIEGGLATCRQGASCRLDWSMEVLVSAFARATPLPGGGQIPAETSADALLTQAHALLPTTAYGQSLANLAASFELTQILPDLERASPDSCILTGVYRVTWQTAVADLTAVGG